MNSCKPVSSQSALALALSSLTLFASVAPAIAVPLVPVEPVEVAQAQRKLRIAVLDFDFSSISSPQILSAFPGIAKGTSDIMVNSLVNEGTYSVIERSQIESILAEQDLGASGRVDASTAAEIGKVLGVDAVIVGTVTQFDVQEKRSGFRVGGLFGEKKRLTTANVQLNVRLISTTTAEILVAAEGSGEADQKDSSTAVLGIGGGSETDNRQQLLSTATRQAIDETVGEIAGASGKVAAAPGALLGAKAVVADFQGGVVVLNRGSSDGYQNGMVVAIERVTRQITDPETGKVLRELTAEVGRVELYDVDRDSSLGRVISGSPPQAGDVANPVSQ